MYVLDNNTVKLVLRNPTTYLQDQIRAHPGQVFLSIVVAEEMIRGVQSQLNHYMRKPEVVLHYSFLQRLIADLNKFPIVSYIDEAEAMYQSFSAETRRVGLRDCRIAASAMTQRPEQFTVVTRNLTDFQTIGCQCVNWIDDPNPTNTI